MRPDAQFDQDGRLTSERYGDVYYSGDGVQETQHVFVGGNDLLERFKSTRGTFVIGETGFGTGLNFLVAAQCFARLAPKPARLVFVTTELHPLSAVTLAAAHEQLPADLQPLARELRAALAAKPTTASQRFALLGGRIVLHVLFGDATEALGCHAFAADAWFLDGFSPARNPAMWSFKLLREVANHTAANGTFATYTVAGHVRRSLQDAGFAVDRAPGFAPKREMLQGQRKPFAGHANAVRLATSEHCLPQHVHVHGAGIAGATVANAFAQRGVRVTAVAPHGIASGASGIQAAIVRPRLWRGGNRTPDAEMLGLAFRFTSNWLQGSEHFRQCGALLCAVDAEDSVRMQQRAANAATSDLVSWLEPDEASERASTRIPFGAAWIPAAGTCDLAALTRGLLQHPNIEVRTHAPTESADLTVLATAGTQHDSSLNIQTQRIRGQAIAVTWPLQSDSPPTVLCTSGYYSPPMANGVAWIGSTFDRDDDSCELRPADDQRIRAHFAALPDFAQNLSLAATKHRFAAVRNASADRLPLIGIVPDAAGNQTVASLAHGSRGAVTAPWAAELLVRAACGEPLPLSIDYWQRLVPGRA